jgi:thiamine transport system permease protein
MLTRGDSRRAILGGTLGLAGIILFAVLGTGALLGAGMAGGQSSLLDAYVWRILRFTLLQASLSAVLSVALAIPFARALARQPQFPGRVWILRLMAVPLGLPVIVGALGLIAVWGRNGWANVMLQHLGLDHPISIYGLSGILLAHVFFNFPLAARVFLAALERLPAEYWLIASNLGMRPASLFRLVEWPELRKQIPALGGLVFMLAATSFTLVLLLGGGPAATTLEVAIYQALRFDFDPARAVSLSLLQVGVTACLLAILALLGRQTIAGHTSGRLPSRPDGRPPARRLGDGTIILTGLAFLALPLASVAGEGLRADLLKLVAEPIFLRALLTSLVISVPSALLAVALAWAISGARQAILLGRGQPAAMLAYAQALPQLSSLILLIPPTVLGTGWFLAIGPARLEPAAPLLIAAINALMALPFVLGILDPAVAAHRARTGRLAVSLGIGGWNRLSRVDWPALRRPLLMAFSFAMALSLGDLGVVALFGSEDLVTLPWLLYSRMGSYRTADAAGLALILAVICLALAAAGTGTTGIGDRDDRR